MNLQEAVIAYGRLHISTQNDWYRWKHINPRFLRPLGIELIGDNEYAKNLSLKQKLSEKYAAGDELLKISTTRYYIAIWGGVKRNSESKIRRYALDQPDNLIKNGYVGVASWSKALCIRDPATYAIYDARVAVSLNALQLIYPVDNPALFPLLVGQNSLINKGSKILACIACENGWEHHRKDMFYRKYTDLLKAISHELNVGICTIEMLLFAKAPTLLLQVLCVEQLA